MQGPARDNDDSARAAALHRYAVMDTPAEPDFDDICRLAASICATPIAVVNFIDRTRQWFKSEIGMGVRESPLDYSICRHAILEDDVLVIPDTLADPRLAGNPLCTGEPHLRFYAGAVIRSPDGFALGTVCVLDHTPRQLRPSQIEGLRTLARQVMTMLELRRHVREEQLARAVVNATQERYRALIEVSPQAVWMTDTEGRQTYVNDYWLKYTGLSEAEALGDGWAQAVHPEYRQRVTDSFSRSIKSGASYEAEIPFRRAADGEYRWFLSRGQPTRDERGAITGWIGVAIEIDERKRTEQRLAQSETRYRTLSEATSDIIWTNSADGQMRGEQPGWARFTGQTFEEYQGYGWATAVHPEDAQPTIDAWNHAVRTRSRFVFEHRVRRYDREWRHCQIHAVPVLDGELIREWVGVHTDVTARRKAEAELLKQGERLREALADATRANSAKDDFLAKLSHELRTPLTPALLTADALLRDRSLPPAIRDDVELILRNVQLETRLIEDLLDVTRIVNGKLELHVEPCDLRGIVDQALEVCRDASQTREISITVDWKAQRRVVRADSARLQQVFWNLLSNALKFTPSGGHIDIRARNVGTDTIRIDVADDGPGIEPERLARLFNIFEQGDRTVTRQFGGLGLGLAICRGVVELHDGRIYAQSDGAGCGSTFTVELQVEVAGTQVAARTNLSPPKEAAPASILLVEDHDHTAEVLQRLLRRAGHTVELARSVAEAMQCAHEKDFDVIISDLGLPDGSGLDLMRSLRDRRGLRGIALSGYGTAEDVTASIDAGFQQHLIKPVEWNALAAAIREVTPARPEPLEPQLV